MAFAVKASTPLASSSAPTTCGRRVGATAPAPGRVAVRKLAASLTLDRAAPEAAAPAPAVAERGLSSVSRTMSRLMENGKTAFIPYITAGDPDLGTTAEALRLLDACGADVIELGVPFSDPYTDGPVIQASAARALAAGATMDGVMSMLKEVTPELSCPVVLFSYFGPIVRRGLIVPDLPYVETCTFRSEAIKNNLELVLLTTPATPADRMKAITAASGGFVYLVSVNGVTGSRQNVNPHVEHLLQEIKQVTDKAVCVGFGISTPDHVRQIVDWGADGVIIGSAMASSPSPAASSSARHPGGQHGAAPGRLAASAARALAAGATMDGIMSMLKEVTPELSCPVLLFSYLGPIVRRGPANFTAAAKQAGVQGLIVPDLPYLEACPFRSEVIKNNLELVLLTTPTTPADRMKAIAAASGGFVYLIAEWGADGVIIGSAMVRQLGEAASPKQGLKRLEKYARSLKNALP
uniref:Uncharacterized protein n=1 Tax=Oryza punctata TaxID=4537 RepID=A0A0E0KK72_ORYPU